MFHRFPWTPRAGFVAVVVALAMPLTGVFAGAAPRENFNERYGELPPPEEFEMGIFAPPGSDLGKYHNQAELKAVLEGYAQKYPAIFKLSVAGHSVQGREIFLVEVHDFAIPNVATVFMDAAHHGHELIGQEALLHFLKRLVEGYGTDPQVTALVESTRFVFVPNVNPDGTARIPQATSYVNTRLNSRCVDLNRNYDAHWELGSAWACGATYRGPSVFSEPESRAVRDVLLRYPVNLYITFHSGVDLFLYPPGWTTAPAAERAIYSEIQKDIEKLTKYKGGQASTTLYVATGTSMDHGGLYVADGARPLSFTWEVYGGGGDWWSYFNPPDSQLETVAAKPYPGLVHLSTVATEYTNVVIDVGAPPTGKDPVPWIVVAQNLGRRTITAPVLGLQLPPGFEVVSSTPTVTSSLVTGQATATVFMVRATTAEEGLHDVTAWISSPTVGKWRSTGQALVVE